MMSKLAAKDNQERKPFKPQIYKSRSQNRSYGQGGYHNWSESRKRGHVVNNSLRQNYRGNRFRGNSRGYSRQDDRGNYRNERYNNYNIDRSRPRERNFTRNYNNSRDRCSGNSRLRSGFRASTNRDRIKSYACREYYHFAGDCNNSREERNLEQLQQMLNMEEEGYRTGSSDENHSCHLNL